MVDGPAGSNGYVGVRDAVKKVSRDALQLGAVRVEQELPSSYSHELSDEIYPGGPYGPVVGTGLGTPGELVLVVEAERLGLVILEVGHLVVRPPGKPMSERRGRLRDRLGLAVRVRGLEVRAMLEKSTARTDSLMNASDPETCSGARTGPRTSTALKLRAVELRATRP